MSKNNQENLIKFVISAMTVVAIVAMGITGALAQSTTFSGKVFDNTKQQTINIGMGASVFENMAGVNFEFSGIPADSNKGIYGGFDYGYKNRGTDDFYTFFGGRAYRLGEDAQIRLGACLGANSAGNTVVDLSSWGMGQVVLYDGESSFIAGVDMGLLIPFKKTGAISAMYSQSTLGPIYRLSFNIRLL